MSFINQIIQGDAKEVLKTLPDSSIDCCVTSPPYWGLRNYGVEGQLGLEPTPELFVENIVAVFSEVKRVLKPTGILWLNIGDSYAGSGRGVGDTKKTSELQRNHSESYVGDIKPIFKTETYKPKDLVGIPWMVAFALRANGWYLRQDIIWHKPNPMPESVKDRCTKAHEYIFLLSKSARYYYNNEDIKTESLEMNWQSRLERDSIKSHPDRLKNGIRTKSTFGNRNGELNRLHSGNNYTDFGKSNKRSVWTVTTKPFSDAHFATFPEELIVDCIKAGCPQGGIVLDPFSGAATTAVVSKKLNRNYLGIELNPEYIAISNKRIHKELGLFNK